MSFSNYQSSAETMCSQKPNLSQKLTVIMPNYNHGGFVVRAIKGIQQQSFQPLELIIVDDASTDDSVLKITEALNGYEAGRLIVNERNSGTNTTVMRGVNEARGEWIYFASSDDFTEKDFFKCAMEATHIAPHAGFVSGVNAFIDQEDTFLYTEKSALVTKKPEYIPPEKASSLLMRYDSWVCGGTTVYRAAALRDVGGFRPELLGLADSFSARVLALKYGAVYVPRVQAYWRRSHGGLAHMSMAKEETFLGIKQAVSNIIEHDLYGLFPKGYKGRLLRRLDYMHKTTDTQGRLFKFLLFLRYRFLDLPWVIERRLDHSLRAWMRRAPYDRRFPRKVG